MILSLLVFDIEEKVIIDGYKFTEFLSLTFIYRFLGKILAFEKIFLIVLKKIIMIKKGIYFLLIVFMGSQNFLAQEKLTQNEKLETLCKVWGFLKYYHPNVAKGTYNWDNQLIEKIKEAEKTETKKQFNKMIFEWIDGLGKVEICKTCNEKNDKKNFLKNFDLNWTDDENIFTKNVIEKLNFIEENRQTGTQYYVNSIPNTNQINLKNEIIYNENFPEINIRLTELFRYWNLVEYFFPYKYQTDLKWNDVLKEMIPRFQNIKNETEYQFALLELVTKVDDSHASYYSKKIEESFGLQYLPTKVKFADNKLVITHLYENKLNLKYDLEIGDIITKIDNKTISEIIEFYKKYVPASNYNVKIRNMIYQNYFFRTNNEFLNLEIERKGKVITVKVPTLNNKNLVFQSTKNEDSKWKILDNNIGFVNMKILEKEDVNKMYEELKNTKTIIFDIRNYPKGTAKSIMNLLSNKPNQFCDIIKPDLSYPGKFQYEDSKNFILGNKENNSPYQGKIIILVNETTQSHAEFSTMILQTFPNSKVIGSQTSGADGNVSKFNLAGKPTVFTGLGVFYPDGKETQRIGIVPDIEVKPTVKGLQENRDEVLERALEYIKNGK
jgi:C-terminal processing protease CtpA/Prc